MGRLLVLVAQPLLKRAVQLKKEQPRRSDVVINRILKQEFGRGVPRSTLYRHLRQQGATRRKLGAGEQKVRCRWTRDQAGALWVGDFEHEAPVLHEGRAVATRLSAWIDCHSRYVVEARYYVRENFDVLVDSLLRAWTHHRTSRELYVDNAKIYHASALKLACVQLNIKLLHRPPRDPAPGGLIERFFQTLQGQLEAEIRAARLLSLGDINRALSAWLAQEYHDPFASSNEPQEVQLYSLDGRHLGVGRLYRREKGYHPQPGPPADKQPIEPSYLDALEVGRQLSHGQRRQSGLDFQSASSRNVWSLSSFATLIAKLLGRAGGLSALSGDELDALRAFHARHDRVHESLVRAAVASAPSPTIPHVLFQLQALLSQGDT